MSHAGRWGGVAWPCLCSWTSLSTKESCSSCSPLCPTRDLSALLQAGGFVSSWILYHLSMSPPSFPPSSRGKPSAAAKSVGEEASALPNPNPADANGHLILFMTFSLSPASPSGVNPMLRCLDQASPTQAPCRASPTPSCISSCSSFLHCTRTQIWKRRQSKLEPTRSWVLPNSTGGKLCSSKTSQNDLCFRAALCHVNPCSFSIRQLLRRNHMEKRHLGPFKSFFPFCSRNVCGLLSLVDLRERMQN